MELFKYVRYINYLSIDIIIIIIIIRMLWFCSCGGKNFNKHKLNNNNGIVKIPKMKNISRYDESFLENPSHIHSL